MATPKTTYAAPDRGSKMTLGLANNPLVAIGFRMAPLTESKSGRLSGHLICPEHQVPVKQQLVCEQDDEVVERTLAYEWEGKYVTLDKSDLAAVENDKRLSLRALVRTEDIDPLYYEKSYMLWPEPGQEAAFDLFAAALRTSKQAAVGTAVLNKATKAVVVRWSNRAECLVAHACTYDDRLAWQKVSLVREGMGQRPQPKKAQAPEAVQLFLAALADGFDFATVKDEYADALEAAVAAAAKGIKAPAQAKTEEAPTVDLIAALRASVAEVPAKGKAKAKA